MIASVEDDLQIFEKSLQIKGVKGTRNLLHFAIEHERYVLICFREKSILYVVIESQNFRKDLFDYLMNFEAVDKNEKSSDGETLIVQILTNSQLSDVKEYFVKTLVSAGADVNMPDSKNFTPLYYALESNNFYLTKLLISYNADLNIKNTEIDSIPHFLMLQTQFSREEKFEILSMMFCYGADIYRKNPNGISLFDISLIENDFEFVEVLLGFVDEDDEIEISPVELNTIFQYKPDFLKLLIKHHSEVLKKRLQSTKSNFLISCDNFDSVLKNLEILFESDDTLKCLVLDLLDSNPLIYNLIYGKQLPENHVQIFTLFLLSYGFEISESDIELVYEKFGYGDFFKNLLMMPTKDNSNKNRTRDSIPAFMYDVNIDLEYLLKNTEKFDHYSLDLLLDFYADRKLLSFCAEFHYIPAIFEKVKKMPQVPSLLELSRNSFRKYLARKLKDGSCCMFYTVLNKLEIGNVYKKIISLETKLYCTV